MNAGFKQECECRSKWNIIFREISEIMRSVFSFGQFGFPMLGLVSAVISYLIRWTVGLCLECQVLEIGVGFLVHSI